MSMRVEVERLREQLARYGHAPYLITTGADLVPHTTHVVVAFDGSAFTCDVGRTTAMNSSARRNVCLLWPPHLPGGFSLIVDGETVVNELKVRVTPTAAVLHRNASAEQGGDVADCEGLDSRQATPDET